MDIKKAFADIENSDLPNKAEIIEALNGHHSKLNGEAKDNRLESQGFKGQLDGMEATMKTLMEAVGKEVPQGNISELDANSFATQIKGLNDSVAVLTADKETAVNDKIAAQKKSQLTELISGKNVVEDFRGDLLNMISSRYNPNSEGNFVTKEGVLMKDDFEKTMEGKSMYIKNNVQGGADTSNAHGTGPKTFADARTAEERFDSV